MQRIDRPPPAHPLLAGLAAFTPLAIDLYLPALPQIAEELSASEASVQVSVSVYLAGLFVGMLLFGPLSDKYGRKRLVLGGIALYALASLGCALAETVDDLLNWRFIQATGGAASAMLMRTIVRDLFSLAESARALSLMFLITMIAALAAPVLGSLVLVVGSWRWLFVGLAAFAAALFCLFARMVPETHHGESRGSSLATVFRAYALVVAEPRAMGYILCASLCFAGMFAYIAVSPFVFIEFFGLSPRAYALVFAANIAGVMALTFVNARWVGLVGPQRMLRHAAVPLLASCAVLLLSAAFGIYGFWMIAGGLFGFVSCTGVLGANCTASLMSLFPENAGAATGLAVAAQFGLAALMSTAASGLYDGTPFAMTLMVALCGLASIAALTLTKQ